MHRRAMLKNLVVLVGAWAVVGSVPAATIATWTFTSGTGSSITNTVADPINVSPEGGAKTNASATNTLPSNGAPTSADLAASTAGTWGNTVQATNNGINVTAQGWSNTVGTGPSSVNNNLTSLGSASPGMTNTLETAYLAVYSGGLGVNNRDGGSTNCLGTTGCDVDTGDVPGTPPEHAIDNEQRYDSVLFNFSQSVSLSQVNLGYLSGDSDIVVLDWVGSSAPTMSSYSSMGTSTGWKLVGAYQNVPLSTNTNINNTNASQACSASVAGSCISSSQYWLIGTYIPFANTSSDNVYDAVKIAALAGFTTPSTSKAPEPGSLGLAGLTIGALALVRRLRRRQRPA